MEHYYSWLSLQARAAALTLRSLFYRPPATCLAHRTCWALIRNVTYVCQLTSIMLNVTMLITMCRQLQQERYERNTIPLGSWKSQQIVTMAPRQPGQRWTSPLVEKWSGCQWVTLIIAWHAQCTNKTCSELYDLQWRCLVWIIKCIVNDIRTHRHCSTKMTVCLMICELEIIQLLHFM